MYQPRSRGITLLLLCTLFCFSTSYGQELVPYRKGTLWGYSDTSGNIVVRPSYERTFMFSAEGLARVKQKGLYGYMSREGKLVIIPQYTNATDFLMGVAEVEKQKRKFCINPDGDPTECNPPDDAETDEGEEDFQPFEVFRDSTGRSRLIFPGTGDTLRSAFDRIQLVSRYFFPATSHFALVSLNNRWGAYDQNGGQIAPVEFEKLDILDVSTYKVRKGNHWGVRSVQGKMIIPLAYDSIGKVSDVQADADSITRREHYIVGKDGRFGVANAAGKVVVPIVYDAVYAPLPCNCPLEFVVQKDGFYGLVDAAGKTILPVEFKAVTPFGGSTLTVVKDSMGRDGYISREGKRYYEN